MRSTQSFLAVLVLALGCQTAPARPAPEPGGRAEAVPAATSATLTAATLPAAKLGVDGGGPALLAAEVRLPERPSRDAACPAGMALVEGDYCPDVEQKCLEWMDTGRYHYFRCAHYAHLGQAACKSKKRVHERFCIDAKERTEPGGDLPLDHQSWTSATALCKAAGARLCLTREWELACEGPEMRPYPYGWDRDSSICNADIDHGLGRIGHLVDHRTPASAHPRCVSPFGIHDMAGNVDEWTTIEGAPRGHREVMHGSWWMPGRNACRSYQAGHGAYYAGTESGARCCADPKP